MIPTNRYRQALSATHLIMVLAREMALKGQPGSHIAAVLDWAEMLPTLMLAHDDKTDEYRSALEAIAIQFPQFRPAVEAFDGPDISDLASRRRRNLTNAAT